MICESNSIGTFNKEKALVEAFSGYCETSRNFVDSSSPYLSAVSRVRAAPGASPTELRGCGAGCDEADWVPHVYEIIGI